MLLCLPRQTGVYPHIDKGMMVAMQERWSKWPPYELIVKLKLQILILMYGFAY